MRHWVCCHSAVHCCSTRQQVIQVAGSQKKGKNKELRVKLSPCPLWTTGKCSGTRARTNTSAHTAKPTFPASKQKKEQSSNLFQENKEGDIGAQRGRQRALAGDQVETFGCLDGTLLPPGCVLHADSSCTVIRHHFPVAAEGQKKHTHTNRKNTVILLCIVIGPPDWKVKETLCFLWTSSRTR